MNTSDARPHLLLVDDSHTSRLLTAEVLTQAGYVVHTAADGREAAAAAAARAYSVILMDLTLSALDGVEVARCLRRLPYPSGDVPILALTGSLSATDRDRYCAAGMDELLTRPRERVELLDVVAQWVEAAADPTWGLDARPGVTPPLVNRLTLAQLEEDVGPDLMPDLLFTFLRETARRLQLLDERVAANDPAGAAHEAHALKGSAGTFGAMALRQAVHEMEQSGRAGDVTRLAALMPEVGRLVTATCELLREEYAALLPGGS